MTDDDERRARAFSIFGVIRFRLPGFGQPVVLCHRLERTQEIPTRGGDLPAVAVAQHMAAGENIDGLNPSGKAPHPRVPLGAAGGENGNVSLE